MIRHVLCGMTTVMATVMAQKLILFKTERDRIEKP